MERRPGAFPPPSAVGVFVDLIVLLPHTAPEEAEEGKWVGGCFS